MHEGEPPDPRSQHHAKLRGYDISDLRARSINISDFEKSDLILAMDGNNAEDCRNMCPPIYHSRINLLTSYCRAHNIDAVPDPYYGGKEHFERVLDIVEDACAGLLISLKSDFL